MARTIRAAAAILFAVVVFGGAGMAAALPSIPADQFEPSPNCGCHSAFLEQWGTSMHAKAMQDPLYLTKRNEADQATNGELGAFCDACHGPVAVMSGERALAIGGMSPQSAEGVGCGFCHSVTGTNQPLGNTSQQVTADGTYRAQFKDAVSPYHETAYSEFHETAEFCGACHNVDHPADRNLHLEATYTEWKNGPYAEEGIVCQDCHMTPGPGVTKPNPGTAAAGGPQRDHVYSMTFVGGNVGLGNAELAQERLEAAATVELSAPDIVSSGDAADITVTITNSGAGHYLPTGLTEVRQMWLEVTATGGDGAQKALGEHRFGTTLMDAKGNSPAELWEAVAIATDDRIPPKESVTDTFTLTMPKDPEITLAATLYYRSCDEETAKKAGVEIPTTTMASVTKVVYGSEEAKAAAAKDARNGMRGGSWTPLVAVLAVGGVAAIVGFAVVRGRRMA